MKRWFAIALVLWANIAALLMFAPTAQAADAAHTFYFQYDGTDILTWREHNPRYETPGSVSHPLNFDYKEASGLVTTISVDPADHKKGTIHFSTGAPAEPIEFLQSEDFDKWLTANNLGPDGKAPENQDNTPPPDCDAGGFTIIICGGIKLSLNGIDWMRENILVPMLEIQPLDKDFTAPNGSQPNKPVYDLWSAFRNLASVAFILIFFLVIFGTAIGLDNYTVKKVLPRLIAGAILVPMSWYICVVMIDIGNILAQGLLAFTSRFIPDSTINLTTNLAGVFLGGGIFLAGAAVVGATTTVGLGLIITIFLAVLVAFLTLVFRKILIILLVILSPLALLAWILPNTQQWWRQWWTNFWRVILMYPLIMALFESGRLMSYVAGAVAGSAFVPFAPQVAHAAEPISNGSNGTLATFLQVLFLYLPLGAVPATPKWVGGFMAQGANLVNKASGAINKRYGKDSEFDKNRAEMRKSKALIAEKDYKTAADAAAAAGNRGRATYLRQMEKWNRARSGTGGGLVGKGMGNQAAVLRREAARTQAMKDASMYGAMRELSAIPGESASQRIETEKRLALDQLAEERGKRVGVLAGSREVSGNQAEITRQRYQAALTNSRLGYGDAYGKATGTNLAELSTPTSAATAAAAAMEHEAEHAAVARGKMAGTARAAWEIDSGTVAAGGAPDIQAARLSRLQGAAFNADSKSKIEFSDTHGKIVGENEVETEILNRDINAADQQMLINQGRHLTADERQAVLNASSRRRTNTAVTSSMLDARTNASKTEEIRNQRVVQENIAPESTGSILEDARLQARTSLANDKTARLQRLDANAKRTMTDQQFFDSTMFDAKTKAADEIGDKWSALDVASNGAPSNSMDAQIDAAREKGMGRRSDQTGERKGTLDSRDADERATHNRMVAGGMSPGSITPEALRNRRISERIGVAAEHVEEKLSTEAGGRPEQLEARHSAETIAAAEGRNYSDDLVTAGGVQAAKDARKKAGQSLGLRDAKSQQNDVRTDILSSRNATSRDETASAGEREGILEGVKDAEQKLIDESGGTLTRAQARRIIENNIGNAAYINMRQRTNQRSSDAAGTVRGINEAMDKAMNDVGLVISPAQAARNVMLKGGQAAEIDAKTKFEDTYGQQRATVTADATSNVTDQERIEAAEYLAGKRLGAKEGEITGALEGAGAEARRDKLVAGTEAAAQASIRRSINSSSEKAKKKYSKDFSEEQSTINAANLNPVTADEIAAQAEKAANVELARANSQTKASLKAQKAAEERALTQLKEEAAAAGKALPTSTSAQTALAQERLMETAGAVAAHKARVETGKGYREDEGSAAGIEASIKRARKLGEAKGVTFDSDPDKARQQAEDYAYELINKQHDRTGYNRVTGELAEANGIQNARERQLNAAMEDLAAKRGIKINKLNKTQEAALRGEAENLVDDAAFTTLSDKTQDKIVAGTGEEIGHLRGQNQKIEEEADAIQKANPKLSRKVAIAQAEQNLATRTLRSAGAKADVATVKGRAQERAATEARDEAINRARFDKDGNEIIAPADATEAEKKLLNNVQGQAEIDTKLSEASQYGTAEGSAKTSDAAITREMENTLDEDWIVDQDNIRKEDGTLVPRGTPLKKGETLFSAVPSHLRHINRDEAISRITRKAIQGGMEQGTRQQAARQAQVAAYNTAAGLSPSAEERQTAYYLSELDKLGNETNNVQAQASPQAISMQRGYAESVREGTQVALDRIVDAKTREAATREIPLYKKDGSADIDPATGQQRTERINRLANDDTGNRSLAEEVRRAYREHDEPALFAAAQRLGMSDSGRYEYAKLRLELFGGAQQDPVTGIEEFGIKAPPGEQLRLYERASEGLNLKGSDDLVKGEGSGFNPKNYSPDRILGWDNNTLRRWAAYTDRLRESANRAAAAGHEDQAKDLWEKRKEAIREMAKVRNEIEGNSNLRGRMNKEKREFLQKIIDDPAYRDAWSMPPSGWSDKWSDILNLRYGPSSSHALATPPAPPAEVGGFKIALDPSEVPPPPTPRTP